MRLIFLVIFTLVVFSNSLFSQTIQEIEGIPVDKNSTMNKTHFMYIVGKTNNGYYFVSRNSKLEYFIIQLDLDKKFKTIKKINLKFKRNTMEFIKVIILDNKLVLFSSFENSEHEALYLFASTINEQTLDSNLDLQKIMEINKKNSNGYTRTNFEFSSDKNKLLIYQFQNRKDQPIMSYTVLNKELKTITGKKNIPLIEINDLESASIDNLGNVFFLGAYSQEQTFTTVETVKKPIDLYQLEMLQKGDLAIKGNVFKTYYSYYSLIFPISGKDTSIKLSNKKAITLRDMSMDVQDDSAVYFYGSIEKNKESVFGNKNISNLIGLIQLKYDKFEGTLTSDTLYFDNYFLTDGWNNYHSKISVRSHYYVHPIFYTNHGERYVLIEEYNYPEYSTFYDLIYVHVDKHGKMDWHNKVIKSNMGFAQSVPFFHNNKMQLFYSNSLKSSNNREGLEIKFYISELTKSGVENTKQINIKPVKNARYIPLHKSVLTFENEELFVLGETANILSRFKKQCFFIIK